MLLSRIHTTIPTDPSTEDIFASASGILFTDDTQVSHGTPGHQVAYHSPRFGELVLDIPAHPDVEEGRRLFAHYLWNSGVVAAEGLERASCHSLIDTNIDDGNEGKDGNGNGSSEASIVTHWDRRYWDVSGADVLELGAGTGLPSLIAALSHARSITISDHPSSPSLTNDTILRNVKRNLVQNPNPELGAKRGDAEPDTPRSVDTNTDALTDADADADTSSIIATATSDISTATDTTTVLKRTPTHINIAGHVWGTSTFTSSTHYGRLASPQPQPGSFTRILTTDCLWMPSQHENLIRTILRYLKNDTETVSEGEGMSVNSASSNLTGRGRWGYGHSGKKSNAGCGSGSVPCALVVGGFHTGRSTVAAFFEMATGSAWGTDRDQDRRLKTDDINKHTDTGLPTDSDADVHVNTHTHANTDTNTPHPQSSSPTPHSRSKSQPTPIQTTDQDSQPVNTHPSNNQKPDEQDSDIDENSDVRAKLRAASIFEVDVDLQRRAWVPVRTGEDKHAAKRWCVCAVLVRW